MTQPVTILLPKTIELRLIEALKKAGSQEIGGILMGEHINYNTFRIIDLTIQFEEGSIYSFRRLVTKFLMQLTQFFKQRDHNYQRFNYLGEWHSHPSFALSPSNVDSHTMQELVNDSRVGAHFAILLIVRLSKDNGLHGNITVYQPQKIPLKGQLIQE